MQDSPEKGAGMWDHGLLSAGAEKFHNKKNLSNAGKYFSKNSINKSCVKVYLIILLD